MDMEKKAITKYTEADYQALVDELAYLEGEKTEEIKKALAFARSLGDLTENSEYDAAKDEQAQVEARKVELKDLIKNAEIIDESEIDESVINLGSNNNCISIYCSNKFYCIQIALLTK